MSDPIELEIDAIKTILQALEPLEEPVRNNVLEYVLKKLGISNFNIPRANQFSPFPANSNLSQSDDPDTIPSQSIHIKKFKDDKSPKSANEMAAIVAYFLRYHALPNEKKETVDAADLETWFRIAEFPLPGGDMRHILNNAKNSGYFDSIGGGKYKLNAIGYNLVKHNLPRTGSSSPVKRPKKPVKKATHKRK